MTDTDIEIREFANHWHFGMVVSAAGRPDSRTAYLHVDYRKITPTDEPAILIETSWDDVGEIDRISFLAEVVNGQQKITKTLPKLGK